MHSLARLKALLSRILFARPLLQTMTSSENGWSAPEFLQICETSKLMLQTLCKPGPSGQCGFHSIHGWPTLVFSKVHTVASASPLSQRPGSRQGGFIVTAFTQYKKFHESAKQHEQCEWRKDATKKRDNLLRCLDNSTDISMQLNTAAQKKAECNKQKLVPVTTAIIFCDMHDMPLRGRNQKAVCSRTCFKFRVDVGDHMLETPQKLPRTQGTLQSAPRMSS